MAKFAVGDVCLGQDFEEPYTQYNNEECEILGVFPLGVSFLGVLPPLYIRGTSYLVRWASDREKYYVSELNLRKKPRKEPLGSWGDIERLTGWNPIKACA